MQRNLKILHVLSNGGARLSGLQCTQLMRYRYRSTDSSQSNTIAIHLNMKDSKKKSRKMVNKHMEAKDSQKKKTIELLHEYNDLKDATQLVLGALATLKSVPIRSVYSTYNLPVEE